MTLVSIIEVDVDVNLGWCEDLVVSQNMPNKKKDKGPEVSKSLKINAEDWCVLDF